MAKTKTQYVCQSCGAVFHRWLGRCEACNEWNTLVEEAGVAEEPRGRTPFANDARPRSICEGEGETLLRISTGSVECDRALGGGIVPGGVTLVGGDPGIGKSTLMLQVAHALAERVGPVLYVSGEESFGQTRLRAERLGAKTEQLMLLPETNVERVRSQIDMGDYVCVIVDSIQSMYAPAMTSVPGSVGQVRECAHEFQRLAKNKTLPVFLVGHVTKDGNIAGPKVLEHLVDTVLYFEGEGRQALRILRSVKNRFGSTQEIGVFEMSETGLRDVENPSALFLDERPQDVSGSAVVPSMEGSRPLLVEVQALVTDSHLASPRRTVSGLNANRVSLVLAVLEKRAGLEFSGRDVFVNVAGGVRLEETAADAALALALVSSLRDVPVHRGVTAFGEIGLAGEVRGVSHSRIRAREASKFGFETCILPSSSVRDADGAGTRIVGVDRIESIIEHGLAG